MESGLWYPGSAPSLLVHFEVPSFPLLGCPSCGPFWWCPLLSPNFQLQGCSDIHKPYLPNPHIKNIWFNCAHVPHHCFHCCLDPLVFLPLFQFLTPPDCQGLLVVVLCGPCMNTCSCAICSLRLTMISPLWLSWSDSNSLPRPVLLLWLSLTSCCPELRVH